MIRTMFLLLVMSSLLLSTVSAGGLISDCQELSVAGVYVLQNDVVGDDCFTLIGEDVVLDLNGYSVSGTGVGVHIVNTSGFEDNLKNGVIEGFDVGILVESSEHVELDDLDILSNGEGVAIYDSEQIIVKHSMILDSVGNGLRFENTPNNLVYNNTIHNSGGVGIVLVESDGSFIRGNHIILNQEQGISVTSDSTFNFVFNNYFNNTENYFIDELLENYWSIELVGGVNIIGGPYLGGNYWSTPMGTGYSETCNDGVFDGICSQVYALTPSNLDFYPLKLYEPTYFVRGDVNRDGSINLADAITLMTTLEDFESFPCEDAADTNDDGEINSADTMYLLNHLFKAGPPLPAPYPREGIDITFDILGCEL